MGTGFRESPERECTKEGLRGRALNHIKRAAGHSVLLFYQWVKVVSELKGGPYHPPTMIYLEIQK